MKKPEKKDEGKEEIKNDLQTNWKIYRRFGENLINQMNGCVMNFDEPPDLVESIRSFLLPPEKYTPTEEEEFLLEICKGPTPSQINKSILTQKHGIPGPSISEIYFKDEMKDQLRFYQKLYNEYLQIKFDKYLKAFTKKTLRKKREMLKDFKKKVSKKTIKKGYEKNLKRLELWQKNNKKSIIEKVENEYSLEPRRLGHIEERSQYLKLINAYKIKFIGDIEETNVYPFTEKIGKDSENLIKKFYIKPYNQLKIFTYKLLSGQHAIDNCGYKNFCDSKKWLQDLLAKESNEINSLVNNMEEEKLELTAMESLVNENKLKYETWSDIVRALCKELLTIVSLILKEQPQFSQYLPIFENMFKMRAARYIMNVRKDIPKDALLTRSIDNRLITAEIYETKEIGAKRTKKYKKPMELDVSEGLDKSRKRFQTDEEFNIYINNVINSLKKIPDLQKSYTDYL